MVYGNDLPENGPLGTLAQNPAHWQIESLLILKGFLTYSRHWPKTMLSATALTVNFWGFAARGPDRAPPRAAWLQAAPAGGAAPKDRLNFLSATRCWWPLRRRRPSGRPCSSSQL